MSTDEDPSYFAVNVFQARLYYSVMVFDCYVMVSVAHGCKIFGHVHIHAEGFKCKVWLVRNFNCF